jgi:hypothetical protein
VVAGFPTVRALLGAFPPMPPNHVPGRSPTAPSPTEEGRA